MPSGFNWTTSLPRPGARCCLWKPSGERWKTKWGNRSVHLLFLVYSTGSIYVCIALPAGLLNKAVCFYNIGRMAWKRLLVVNNTYYSAPQQMELEKVQNELREADKQLLATDESKKVEGQSDDDSD
jgi:hypothetical protein